MHARLAENVRSTAQNVRKGGGASFLKTKTLKSKNNVKDMICQNIMLYNVKNSAMSKLMLYNQFNAM